MNQEIRNYIIYISKSIKSMIIIQYKNYLHAELQTLPLSKTKNQIQIRYDLRILKLIPLIWCKEIILIK